MSLNTTFLTYIYNNNLMTGTIKVNNSAFETGKDYYTMTMTCSNSRGIDTFVYHITSSNGNLPAIILGGSANAGTPWGCPFFGSWGGLSPYMDSIISLPNTMVSTLYSETHGIDNVPFYSYALGNVGGGNIGGGDAILIEIDADFPIFMGTPYVANNDPNYTEYRCTQDNNLSTYCTEIMVNNDLAHVSSAINYYSVTNTIPYNKVWSIQNYFKANGTIAQTKGYDFKIRPTAKIAMYVTNQIEGDATPNAHIVISEYPCYVKPYNAPDNAYAESSNIDSTYWWGEWQDTENGITYIGYGSTNIPIFESQEDAQKYFDGELTIDDAINSGDTTIRTSTIGDYLDTTDIPTINMSSSGVGVYVYALSEAQIKDIMSNYLYTTDPQTQTTIGDALWLWGNNPIDFMVDCYYIPFDISSFYTTINANLKFGTYQFTGTSFPAVKETNGNRLTLFSTTFEGVYGGWRDYTQFNYDLYLPFYGFFPLDIYRYLNHTIKCEMMFDLTTHNIRYYLYVDGKITDRIDASVGISIPIMATDMVNKSKHDRDIHYGVLTDSISAGASIGMGVTSNDFGGAVTGIIGGVSHIISGVKQYQELNTQATQGVHGGFSSSMNVYDVMYAYLRITERQAIIPSKVNDLYNYPSYYMGALASLSGYCEIEDVQLYSNATEEEQEEIRGLLKGGVIF